MATQLGEGELHLLDGLTRIECDDPLWRINERLIGKAVAHETPGPRPNFIQVLANHFIVG
jgi:hypothetical protein